MLWKYFRFELKLLIRNKFNWFLGLAFILFFPLYFPHYADSDKDSIQSIKNAESGHYISIFNVFPEEMRETTKGEEIYNNLLEQASLLNKQRYSLWKDGDFDVYIESGLKLNELRLRLYELDNEGVHPDYIVPKKEIHKEDALLHYYQKYNLSVEPDLPTASHYLPVALEKVNGLLFMLFVLFIGSAMLTHDHQKRTVMSIFPISFIQKAIVKTGIHLGQIIMFLVLGVALGGVVASREAAWGNFTSPMLLYQQGGFIAISTTRYILYMLIAMALFASLLLLAFILVNTLIKNLYASVLMIVLIFLTPTVLNFAGLHIDLLQPISIIDIGPILNGDAAALYGNDALDYRLAAIWLLVINAGILAVLFVGTKIKYRQRNATHAFEAGKGRE